MDLEDDIQFKNERFEMTRGNLCAFRPGPWMELRLYEKEEAQANHKEHYRRYLSHPRFLETSVAFVGHEDIYNNWRGRLRAQRFFDTLAGFHQGTLDLSGRHPTRYESHRGRFQSFVGEFVRVIRYITAVIQKEEHCGNEVMKYPEYEFSQPTVYESFKTKWRLSRFVPLDFYAKRIKDVSLVMRTNPPKFQRLCLLDLPPELLDTIMNLGGDYTALTLGATCHALRFASIPYIIGAPRLTLKLNTSLLNKDVEHSIHYLSPEESIAAIRAAVENARARMLSQAEFILAHHGILRRMRTLCITDEWKQPLRAIASAASGSNNCIEFSNTLHSRIMDILERVDLTTFDMRMVCLTSQMLKAFSSMKSLRTINLEDCPCLLPYPTQISLLPPLSSVVNTSLVFHTEADGASLELLALMPNILFAVVRCLNASDAPFHLPELPERFAERCNPFRSLERLDISYMSINSIDQLSSWFGAGGINSNDLRLTHFRLTMNRGLNQAELVNLIDVLETAPLRVLVLEGIRYAGLDLFERLGRTFPLLQALTLILRANNSQMTTKPCTWPHTTGEYASRLSLFQHLKYFGWNFRLDPLEEHSPWDLPHFEVGFPDPHNTHLQREWLEATAQHMFCDWSCVPRLFQAYCGTLENLHFICRTDLSYAFSITHENDGRRTVMYRIQHTAYGIEYQPGCPSYPVGADTHPWYFGGPRDTY